jgi:hypothetical protein
MMVGVYLIAAATCLPWKLPSQPPAFAGDFGDGAA